MGEQILNGEIKMFTTDLIVLPDYSPKLVDELRKQNSKLEIGWGEYDLIQAIDSDIGKRSYECS